MIMRLHQVLIENANARNLVSINEPPLDVELLADMIQANAKPWLDATNNGREILYRGVVSPPKSYVAFTRPPRPDRKPKDTSQTNHRIANAMIASVGFPGYADRTNSVFCISFKIQAAEYGELFVPIPIGEFRYTWSPVYADFYSLLGHDNFLSTAVHLLKDEIEARYIHDSERTLAEYERQLQLYRDYLKQPGLPNSDRDRYFSMLANLKSAIGKAEFLRNHTHTPTHPTQVKMMTDILSDPKNYDPRKVVDVILPDQGLSRAVREEHEVMIKADNILYIAPELYNLVQYRLETGNLPSSEAITQTSGVLRRAYGGGA
jgi:hypothetical protein